MAQRTVVTMIDDLDGGEATQTVAFALEGAAYEIDLSDANADGLRKALESYAAVARKTATARKSPGRPLRDKARNDSVRAWAREEGLSISARGRIPEEIYSKWQAAGNPAPRLPVPTAADRAVRSAPVPSVPEPPVRGGGRTRRAAATVPLDTV
jgi:hypothetical protein